MNRQRKTHTNSKGIDLQFVVSLSVSPLLKRAFSHTDLSSSSRSQTLSGPPPQPLTAVSGKFRRQDHVRVVTQPTLGVKTRTARRDPPHQTGRCGHLYREGRRHPYRVEEDTTSRVDVGGQVGLETVSVLWDWERLSWGLFQRFRVRPLGGRGTASSTSRPSAKPPRRLPVRAWSPERAREATVVQRLVHPRLLSGGDRRSHRWTSLGSLRPIPHFESYHSPLPRKGLRRRPWRATRCWKQMSLPAVYSL